MPVVLIMFSPSVWLSCQLVTEPCQLLLLTHYCRLFCNSLLLGVLSWASCRHLFFHLLASWPRPVLPPSEGLMLYLCPVSIQLSPSTAPAPSIWKQAPAGRCLHTAWDASCCLRITTVAHLLPIYTISIKVTLYLQVLKNVQFLTWVTCAKLYFLTNRPMCTQKTLEHWTTQL